MRSKYSSSPPWKPLEADPRVLLPKTHLYKAALIPHELNAFNLQSIDILLAEVESLAIDRGPSNINTLVQS